MIFYTSDHHFHHTNILEYAERPFSSLEEHNEALIERYNSKVGDDDLVYFLGDIFFNKKDWAEEAMRRLKGHKRLVMGNHDRMSVTKFKSMGFEEVYKKQTLVWINGRHCVLSHYPHVCHPTLEFILHGHSHVREKREGRNIHVGVDAWNYFPASEDEIEELMKEREAELGGSE